MTIRVLLADDHAIMREGLHALLGATPGITVIAEVANGREALRRCEDLTPDVLVMDISMPDLNGIEAARMIREKCPTTRIVILSMHSTTEHVFRAFDAGASGYVLKESAGAEVITAVHTAYAGGRYLSPALGDIAREARLSEARESPLNSLSTRERQVL